MKVVCRCQDRCMADEDALSREYEQVTQMLDALDTAIAERDTAKARATATARAVGGQLERLGYLARIAGIPFDRELARRLYWDYPDLLVSEIAHPMGAHVSSVAREMGNGAVERPCGGACGRIITWQVSSRTDARKQARLCPECSAELEARRAQRFAEWQVERVRGSEDDRQMLREALERGGEPRRYAEFPGVPGTWAVDENGVPLVLID